MRQLVLPLALFALLMALFLWGMNNVDATTQSEQLKIAERAVTRAVVKCYALEGQYPPSVAYLRENYGLSVDESKYIVHFDFFWGNIMPQIFVFPRNQGFDLSHT